MTTATPAEERGLGVRIGRIKGIPVYLSPSWFVIAIVIVVIVSEPVLSTRPAYGIGLGVAQALLLLVSVLVHEAAHGVTALAFGMPVIRIVATLWGGHTSLEAGRSTPGRMAGVAVAGPAANGLLAGLSFAVLPLFGDGLPGDLVQGLAIINGSLAVLNILPGMPLDGGQVVECLVWKGTGNRNTGAVVAGWCGRVVALLVVAWFFGRPLLDGASPGLGSIWVLVIGSVLWSGATQSIRRGQMLGSIASVRLEQVLRPAVSLPATATVEQAAVVGNRQLVVTDDAGRPAAYVGAAELSQVPAQVRTVTPLSAVATYQQPGWVIEANPADDVLTAVATMQRLDLQLLAVTQNGRVIGVVHAGDVGRALSRN